jgi:hypothetical protein
MQRYYYRSEVEIGCNCSKQLCCSIQVAILPLTINNITHPMNNTPAVSLTQPLYSLGYCTNTHLTSSSLTLYTHTPLPPFFTCTPHTHLYSFFTCTLYTHTLPPSLTCTSVRTHILPPFLLTLHPVHTHTLLLSLNLHVLTSFLTLQFLYVHTFLASSSSLCTL